MSTEDFLVDFYIKYIKMRNIVPASPLYVFQEFDKVAGYVDQKKPNLKDEHSKARLYWIANILQKTWRDQHEKGKPVTLYEEMYKSELKRLREEVRTTLESERRFPKIDRKTLEEFFRRKGNPEESTGNTGENQFSSESKKSINEGKDPKGEPKEIVIHPEAEVIAQVPGYNPVVMPKLQD